MGAPGARRRARGYALQVLYSLDLNPEMAIDDALAEFWGAFEHEDDTAAVEFAEELVRAAHAQQLEIDGVVQQASRNWRLERMSRVDRNILRLATFELLARPDVPVRVVINECVNLAKRFGAIDGHKYINGCLDGVARSLREIEINADAGG